MEKQEDAPPAWPEDAVEKQEEVLEGASAAAVVAAPVAVGDAADATAAEAEGEILETDAFVDEFYGDEAFEDGNASGSTVPAAAESAADDEVMETNAAVEVERVEVTGPGAAEGEDEAFTHVEGAARGKDAVRKRRTRRLDRDERLDEGTWVEVLDGPNRYPAHVVRHDEDTRLYDVEYDNEKQDMSTVDWKRIRVEDAGRSAKICGTFGCTRPDRHTGLHNGPAVDNARPRQPRESWQPDDYRVSSGSAAGPSRVDGIHGRRSSWRQEQGGRRCKSSSTRRARWRLWRLRWISSPMMVV